MDLGRTFQAIEIELHVAPFSLFPEVDVMVFAARFEINVWRQSGANSLRSDGSKVRPSAGACLAKRNTRLALPVGIVAHLQADMIA